MKWATQLTNFFSNWIRIKERGYKYSKISLFLLWWNWRSGRKKKDPTVPARTIEFYQHKIVATTIHQSETFQRLRNSSIYIYWVFCISYVHDEAMNWSASGPIRNEEGIPYSPFEIRRKNEIGNLTLPYQAHALMHPSLTRIVTV